MPTKLSSIPSERKRGTMNFKKGDIVRSKPGSPNGVYEAVVIDPTSVQGFLKVRVTKVIEPTRYGDVRVGKVLCPFEDSFELKASRRPAGAREMDERFARRAAAKSQDRQAQWQQGFNDGKRTAEDASRTTLRELRSELARLRQENIRLKAAVASTQTHLGNLVRDIQKAR